MMKQLVFMFAILSFALTATAQDPTIDKGSGIMYFSGKPGVTPNILYGSEYAFDVANNKVYAWNRDSSAWYPYPDISHSFSVPSGDPGTDSKLHINRTNGKLYRWTGSAWAELGTGTTLNPISTETTRRYCPSHGISLSSYAGNIAAIRGTCDLANALASDSLQSAYVIDSLHQDTILVQVSGLVSRPGHGLTPGTVYFLQDTPNGQSGTSSGTIEAKTFVVLDDDNIQLIDPSASSSVLYSPVINIPAAAFSVYGGDPKAPNDTTVQNIAEAYAAANVIRPNSYLIAYNSAISDNEIYRANADGSSTPFHVWQWNGEKVTRLSSRPVAIDLEDTLYGGSGTLVLTPISPAGSEPTTAEVVTWLEANYDNNGLRLPNGSLLYWTGAGTQAEPDLMWAVMDDLSSTGATNFERIVKKVAGGGVDQDISKPTPDSIAISSGSTIVDRSLMQALSAGNVDFTADSTQLLIRDFDWLRISSPSGREWGYFDLFFRDNEFNGLSYFTSNASETKSADILVNESDYRLRNFRTPMTRELYLRNSSDLFSTLSVQSTSPTFKRSQISVGDHGAGILLWPRGSANDQDTLFYTSLGTMLGSSGTIGDTTAVRQGIFDVGIQTYNAQKIYSFLSVDMTNTTENSIAFYDSLYVFPNSTPPGDTSIMYFSAAGVPGWVQPAALGAGGGSGSTEVADGVTILGDGSGGSPFRVDTALIATTTALVDSIAGIGAGDVTGPGSSTDNAIARFDGTTGKLVQNSGVTIDD